MQQPSSGGDPLLCKRSPKHLCGRNRWSMFSSLALWYSLSWYIQVKYLREKNEAELSLFFYELEFQGKGIQYLLPSYLWADIDPSKYLLKNCNMPQVKCPCEICPLVKKPTYHRGWELPYYILPLSLKSPSKVPPPQRVFQGINMCFAIDS